ncbi:MAG: hypothetical protein MK066_13870, partial [Crocinitomicaceae bacterium]|nr:hypothetical protein [Crocinitomicaceae bacterium]
MRFVSFIICFISAVTYGQSGELNVAFGNQAKLKIDIDDLDELVGLTKDTNGNTFFYGNTSDNQLGVYPFDFFIGKMDPFGNLDNGFGVNGIFRSDFPGFGISSIQKAVFHSTGIYFIGSGANQNVIDTNSLFIGKLNLDGQLDLSFANNGYYTSNFMGGYNTAGSIIIDTEDKIVFCGSTTDDLGTLVEYPLVGRLLLDGTADSTFGSTGVVVWDYYQGALLNYMELRPSQDRHGEGAYLSEIIEVNNTYFVSGRYLVTSFSQAHFMSLTKSGEMNPNFISTGPQVFQIDPGYNHTVMDVEFDGEFIYLGLRTNGSFYDKKQLIQKIDTTGIFGDLIVHEEIGQDLQTRYVEVWNDRVFTGGYQLDDANIAPGVHSDKFMLMAYGNDMLELSDFNFVH